MTEFTLIDRYCQNIGRVHSDTRIGVGDDAAVISVPNDKELVISVDTMVEGVHFFTEVTPANLAHKLLAVNLSDMAAMGAVPRWATLALTLPSEDSQWLAAFSESLNLCAEQYGVQLIGGDTTQGSLTLSLQIMGLVPQGQALTRAAAKPGDDVYITNNVGDAALALALLKKQIQVEGIDQSALLKALELPEPQLDMGQALLPFACACIDVSDGLVADLSHIADRSEVSINLDVTQIPISKNYQAYVAQGGNLALALSGGDDYQLAFTAAAEHAVAINSVAQSLNVDVSKIGQVVNRMQQPLNLHADGDDYILDNVTGYQHFND